MNASVAIQVLPKVNGDEETIRIVDAVIDYIKSTGLNYFVGPCETSIEGDYDELMEIIKQCQKVAVAAATGGMITETVAKDNTIQQAVQNAIGTSTVVTAPGVVSQLPPVQQAVAVANPVGGVVTQSA